MSIVVGGCLGVHSRARGKRMTDSGSRRGTQVVKEWEIQTYIFPHHTDVSSENKDWTEELDKYYLSTSWLMYDLRRYWYPGAHLIHPPFLSSLVIHANNSFPGGQGLMSKEDKRVRATHLIMLPFMCSLNWATPAMPAEWKLLIWWCFAISATWYLFFYLLLAIYLINSLFQNRSDSYNRSFSRLYRITV